MPATKGYRVARGTRGSYRVVCRGCGVALGWHPTREQAEDSAHFAALWSTEYGCRRCEARILSTNAGRAQWRPY